MSIIVRPMRKSIECRREVLLVDIAKIAVEFFELDVVVGEDVFHGVVGETSIIIGYLKNIKVLSGMQPHVT